MLIFSDEIHSDIVFEPYNHIPILSINKAKDISILAHSIGKTFNTSGFKSSFYIIENEHLRKKIINSQKLAHVDNINLIGKLAIQTLFSPEGADYKRQLVSYLQENTSIVYNKLLVKKNLTPNISVRS